MSTSNNKSSDKNTNPPKGSNQPSRTRTKRIGSYAVKNTPRARFRFFGSLALKANTDSEKQTSLTKDTTKAEKKSHSKLKDSKKPDKSTRSTFWHRLDIRFPWLKLAGVIIIGLIILADLLDLTVSDLKDPSDRIRVAPMSKHLRASERVLEGKKLVALTFDDGPAPSTTPILLDTLFEKDVPATFFMLGYMVRNNPDLAKRIDKEYHSASSHTMYHQNLVRIPATAIESDINEAKTIIESAIGHPPEYTRPPYGNVNDAVKNIANTPIILWSVDTLDWQSKNVDSIVATTMSQVHDGAVILMHDIYPTSVEAVPIIIDNLRKEGYEFVTLQELASARGTSLANGEVYYRILP